MSCQAENMIFFFLDECCFGECEVERTWELLVHLEGGSVCILRVRKKMPKKLCRVVILKVWFFFFTKSCWDGV